MNIKKIITMGLAAIMAVSAMSISAFACENEEDAVVSFLSADGESYIYLSEEDIANGNNTVVGYDGITFEVEETETPINLFSVMSVSSVFDTSLTEVPYEDNDDVSVLSILNRTRTGSFSVPKSKQRFSNAIFQNKTNTAALMSVSPNAAFGKKVTFSLCAHEIITSPLVNLKPDTNNTYGVSATGLSSNWNLYLYVNNQMTSTASGTVTISGYNG